MPSFYDNFERANGAPGGDWVQQTGSPTIAGGRLQGAAQWVAVNTAISDAGRMEVSVHALYGGTATIFAGPIVKADPGTANAYMARIYLVTGVYYFQLCKGGTGGQTVLASESLGAYFPPYNTIYISWDQGNLTATLNGGHTLTAIDNDYSAQIYGGAHGYAAASGVDDILIVAGAASELLVSPDPIPNYGECTEVTISRADASWTPGTPGSPIFTVDHGTITAQTVDSATSATLTYCPGTFLGNATFTDPTTGQTVTVLVTSDPTLVEPPGGGAECRLDEAGAALINDTADEAPLTKRLFARNSYVGTAPIDVTYEETIRWLADYLINNGWNDINPPDATIARILMWVSGGYLPTMATPAPPSQTTLKEDLAGILDEQTELADNILSYFTALTETLGGSPVLSHQDLLDAIQAGGGGGNADVLAQLDAMWGPAFPTLTDLRQLLIFLQGTHPWSLDDVVSRIDDRPTNLAFTTAIAGLSGGIGALALEIAALAAAETADAASSAAGAASAAGALAWLLANGPTLVDTLHDIIDLLKPASPAKALPPIWPGVDRVTYGPTIPIESNQEVVGPMHGVEVVITGCQSGTRFFDYDGVRNYGHIGALTFFNDANYSELYQTLGSARAVYVPKTMAQASVCRLYRSRQVTGTIRPWTVNP